MHFIIIEKEEIRSMQTPSFNVKQQ